jgi:hypothetical protein
LHLLFEINQVAEAMQIWRSPWLTDENNRDFRQQKNRKPVKPYGAEQVLRKCLKKPEALRGQLVY